MTNFVFQVALFYHPYDFYPHHNDHQMTTKHTHKRKKTDLREVSHQKRTALDSSNNSLKICKISEASTQLTTLPDSLVVKIFTNLNSLGWQNLSRTNKRLQLLSYHPVVAYSMIKQPIHLPLFKKFMDVAHHLMTKLDLSRFTDLVDEDLLTLPKHLEWLSVKGCTKLTKNFLKKLPKTLRVLNVENCPQFTDEDFLILSPVIDVIKKTFCYFTTDEMIQFHPYC